MTTPAHVTTAIAELPSPVCAYLYDPDVLSAKVAAFRAAIPAGSGIHYAMKANAHPALLRRAAIECDGIEVASEGELDLARHAGARHIIFSGPGKTDSALRKALARAEATVINAESVQELRRVNQIAASRGTTANVALRVNRAASVPHGTHRMTGTPTPFGIDETQVSDAIALTSRLDAVRLTGLHLHAVSNNLDAAAHAAFVTASLCFADDLARRHNLRWQTVNLGGGIGADPAARGEFDMGMFARQLTAPADTTLVFEPGRYFTAECGWYACEVLDLKRTQQRDFAVVRGGTHHFRLPAAWHYDHHASVQSTNRWQYDWKRPEVRRTTVDVVGELCTPRDVLCRDLPVEHLAVGDILVFARTGAYGWDTAHHDFLHHDPPVFVVV